ncbi:MAG TPA: Lpg1974 family pore-forming outer membrane protein [Chlamydiales bacterium]|jgi:hypothetical protein
MRTICFAVCLAAFPLVAELKFDDRLDSVERKIKSARSEGEGCARSTARFPSGRPVYSGYGVWVTADVLYWTAFEGGTDFAYTTATAPSMTGSVYATRFDWDAGYRLGVSYSWPQDNWDLTALVSQVNPVSQVGKAVQAPLNINPVLGSGDFTTGTNASEHWDLKFLALDLELGRSYFVSRYLYLRPHFGARGAWIHQKATGQFATATQAEAVQLRNDFDGGGLRLGLDTKWFFDNHWNMSLASSVSTLYGHFKVGNQRNIFTSATGIKTYTSDEVGSVNRIVPAAQMALGAGWETAFACDRNYISFNVLYELNYWWRQNQLAFFQGAQEAPYGTRYSDDLGFHGVTFDMQLSF